MKTHQYFFFYTSILFLLFFALTGSVTAIQPPSSTLLAAETLRNRGYTIFASSLLSISSNFSGTIFAPPDYSFSFTSAIFFPNYRPKLLLYHTLKPPQILKYEQLVSLSQNQELATLYSNTCLFFTKNFGNEPIISSTPIKNRMVSSVKIRQPDVYVDENITVHGIYSVLDPTFAVKCPDSVSLSVNRTFLDHAVRALRRTGYSTVAAAMSVRRNELLGLDSVTVFAVSDNDFFRRNGGFRFDFRKHVVLVRRRLEELVSGMVLETLAPNKSVVVESVGNDVFIAGVNVSRSEVYRNRWVVVISVPGSFDDVSDVSEMFPANLTEVPSSSPSSDGFVDFGRISTSPDKSGPAASPAPDGGGVHVRQCDVSGAVSVGVEGGDLFCSVEKRRGLVEEVVSTGPSETEKVKVVEKVNIADDLFFYM